MPGTGWLSVKHRVAIAPMATEAALPSDSHRFLPRSAPHAALAAAPRCRLQHHRRISCIYVWHSHVQQEEVQRTGYRSFSCRSAAGAAHDIDIVQRCIRPVIEAHTCFSEARQELAALVMHCWQQLRQLCSKPSTHLHAPSNLCPCRASDPSRCRGRSGTALPRTSSADGS